MYLIPRNISNKFEFFPGLGWFELFVLLLSAGVGYLISLFLGIFIQSPARFITIIMFGGFGYIASRPVLADGTSFMQLVKYFWQFSKGQKLYLYERGGF